MIRSIVLIVALLGSGSAAADEATYLIQCDIVNGERLLGSPAVVAKSGSKVEVSVTDTYALSLIAEGQDNNRVKLSTDIALNGESHSRTLLRKRNINHALLF